MSDNRVRVLQFITPAGFYGAERWIIALANNINRNHLLCDLAVTRESDDQDLSIARYYPEDAGSVHYICMKGRFDLRVVQRLARIIRERNIDVIHTHGYKSDILGLLAARHTGISCISTPHGFSGKVGFKLSVFIRLGLLALRYFDAVVPLSRELMSDMEKAKISGNKVRFIANGVDLTEIDPIRSSIEALGERSASDNRTIGFIGQLIPRKGIPDLLVAFDQLYESNKNLQLRLLGDGRQRGELEEQAKQLESSRSIQFLGFRPDRLDELRRFDLFVMTSSLEGIPRCMMEAMAVGVPVVAYDIPGVDQLVEHGKTGLLVSHGDVPALVEACREVLENQSLAKKLSEAARSKIEREYSASRMAKEYEELFRDLLTRPSLTEPESRGSN